MALAERLIESEVIDADELRKIIDENSPSPVLVPGQCRTIENELRQRFKNQRSNAAPTRPRAAERKPFKTLLSLGEGGGVSRRMRERWRYRKHQALTQRSLTPALSRRGLCTIIPVCTKIRPRLHKNYRRRGPESQSKPAANSLAIWATPSGEISSPAVHPGFSTKPQAGGIRETR